MKFVIAPTFKEIFDEDAPSILSLISGIPTRLIVGLVTVMNAELYLNIVKTESQVKLLRFLLRRQAPELRYRIYAKIRNQIAKQNKKEFAIFSVSINFQFLQFALTHFYEDENFDDTSPEHELNLLKAYLLISQEEFNKVVLDTNTNSQIDFFRKNTWPLMIGQFQLNHPYNYFNAIVKAKCFLDALEFESEYHSYVKSFLKRYGEQNSLSYIFRFANT